MPCRRLLRSPAAGAPLVEVRALRAQRRVVAVAGIEPRVVVVDVEHAGRDVLAERVEALAGVLRVADASREETVAGEEVRVPGRFGVGQGDRAGSVAAQVD